MFQPNLNNFSVHISKLEGKLEPDNFLEWLHMVERVFDFKEITEEKKVELVTLNLRRYASLWWTNMSGKRARKTK